jgi:hypothetical protein
MDGAVAHIKQVRRDAAMTFLQAYSEGRPLSELETELPSELEANGQEEAAFIVRSFFRVPGIERGSVSGCEIPTREGPGRKTAETIPLHRG